MALSASDTIPIRQGGTTEWVSISTLAALISQIIGDSSSGGSNAGVPISALPGDTEINGDESLLTSEAKQVSLQDVKSHILRDVPGTDVVLEKCAGGVRFRVVK